MTPEDAGIPTRLSVVYDERCALCRRCRDWLMQQRCLIHVELLPAGSEQARLRYGTLPWLGSELVVADEHGHVWIGPAGFLMCLWATARYRSWSYRLSAPALAPLAERFFKHVSRRRGTWSRWMEPQSDECTWCEQATIGNPS